MDYVINQNTSVDELFAYLTNCWTYGKVMELKAQLNRG